MLAFIGQSIDLAFFSYQKYRLIVNFHTFKEFSFSSSALRAKTHDGSGILLTPI
jgi:hypothetical protein